MKRDPIEVIQETLTQDELLAQLAEEATELAHAALKLRRAYGGTNPTPVPAKKAYEGLLEEIADVSNCLVVLGYDGSLAKVRTSLLMTEKLHRWANRLEEAGKQ